MNAINPQHYRRGGLQAIQVIDAFFCDNYNLGNVFKYLVRAGHKDPSKYREDLLKARWYLDHELEGKRGGTNPRYS